MPVVEYVVVPCNGRWKHRAVRFPDVREAGQSGIVGRHFEGPERRGVDERRIELASSYDRKVIVERGITGREFECAVLGNDNPVAAAPCEILPSREFYDYEDKYLLDQAQTVIPAESVAEQTAKMQRLAVECYRAVECEGMARVDFLLETATGELYINEINTIPGFTSISMYPKMWEYSGLPMPKLIDRLIELALERHAARASVCDIQSDMK